MATNDHYRIPDATSLSRGVSRWRYCSGKRETPRDKLVASQKQSQPVEAASVKLHDARSWHLSQSCLVRFSKFHLGRLKLKVRTSCCLIGFPSRRVGLKTHFLAASSAAERSAGWPLMAFASITRPFSLMVIAT